MGKLSLFAAEYIFDQPLMIAKHKLDAILAVLSERIGLGAVNIAPVLGLDHQHDTERHADMMALTNEMSGLAVIPVYGSLVNRATPVQAMSGLTSYESISAQLDAALDNPDVTAIVLDVDSPGGMVSGAFDLADKIYEARQKKPVFSIINETAFSAGYLIASAAQKVYIPRTGNAGSIGVVMTHIDETKKDEMEGREFTYIFAGDKKVDFTSHRPLSDSAKADAQGKVDEIYGMFVEAISRNRGMQATAVMNTKAGMFLGKSAVEAGLADAVVSSEEAMSLIVQEINTMNMKTDKGVVADNGQSKNTVEANATEKTEAVVETATAQVAAATATPVVEATPVNDRAVNAEIVRVCNIAGAPQLAAEYIEKGMSVAEAKASLFDAQAKGEIAVTSAVRTEKSETEESEGADLLVAAFKAQAK